MAAIRASNCDLTILDNIDSSSFDPSIHTYIMSSMSTFGNIYGLPIDKSLEADLASFII